MIFNWYENSKKIHLTKELTHEDGQDIKGQHSQEIAYIRYLMSLDKTKQQMFECFTKIKNGSANIFSNDEEQQKTLFKSRYNKAKKLGPLTSNEAEMNNVIVYKKEIDYLNKLKAPLWIRQYLLGILVWYKTINKRYKVVIKDTKWYTWILSQCKNHYQYKKKIDTITEWNRKNKFPIKTNTFDYENKRGGYKYKASGVSVQLSWCKKSGEIITDHATLENFTALFQFLKPATFKCNNCGKLYDCDKININSLHLCEECKKTHRNAYQAKLMKNKRQNAKKEEC